MDHDGVLCLLDSKPSEFDKGAVKVLNEILTAIPDVEIVVSSDWRHHFTLPALKQLYTDQGVIKQPIGFTGYVSSDANQLQLEQCRVAEIRNWLKTHYIGLVPMLGWCVVDDMDLSALGNFVQTPRIREGIKQTGVKEKIIKILNKTY